MRKRGKLSEKKNALGFGYNSCQWKEGTKVLKEKHKTVAAVVAVVLAVLMVASMIVPAFL